MATTVIDQLLVTLGLDSSGYKKGAAEAEKSQKNFRESTKKTGDEIGSSLKNIGKEVAGLFLVFEGVKETLKFFGDLNAELANMGRFARNIGMSAHEVNGWGQAIELAGGKAEEAQGDLAKLQNDIVNFRTKGEISPLLLLMQRTGVAIQDADGKQRKLTDIYKDFGDVLRRTDLATAHTWATQAGLSDSTFNLITMEAKARQELIDKAEANNKVTEESTKRAEQLQEKWREIKQNIKSAGLELLEAFQPAIDVVLAGVIKLVDFVKNLFHMIANGYRLLSDSLQNIPGVATLRDKVSRGGEALFNWLGGVAGSADAAVREQAGAAASGTSATSPGAGSPGAAEGVAGSVGARNNNPGNLRFAHQKGAVGADAKGFAIFRTWQEGVDAARSQIALDASRGLTSVSSIIRSWAPPNENNTEAYIADVSKRLGVQSGDALNASQFAALANAIFIHEGSVKASSFANSAAVGVGVAGSPKPGGPAGGSQTTVEIGSMHIHTAATDADGIASTVAPAIKRKLATSQLNSGMS